ncbi:MAG: LLM class flavin-dependent oxidoreductase [Methylomicrobium sp.]
MRIVKTAKRQMSLTLHLPATFNDGRAHRQSYTPDAWNWVLADYRCIVQKAERAKLDAVILSPKTHGHGQASPDDPLKLSIELARVTERIGLVTPVCTDHNDPYNLAASLAALDHISRGRAGWHPKPEKPQTSSVRTEMTRDYVDLVTGLWSSWEVEALCDELPALTAVGADVCTTRRVGSTRSFVVEPTRPVFYGHPVLLQSIASQADIEFAARSAEVVLSKTADPLSAQSLSSRLKDKARRYGRQPEHLKMMIGVMPVIGETAEAARQKYQALCESVERDASVSPLSLFDAVAGPCRCSTRLSSIDPLADDSMKEGMRHGDDRCAIRDGNEELTVVIGTAAQVAEQLFEWFSHEFVDGFAIVPPHCAGGLDDFIDCVVPELQRKGVFRSEYRGRSLREHFALPGPVDSGTKRMFQFSLSF